jgi:starvation-inducible outer membrane lipoprotein
VTRAFIYALCLLVAGCSLVYFNGNPPPEQIEAATIKQPACVFNCNETSATTQQQGARIDGSVGNFQSEKPLTTNTTSTNTQAKERSQ